jgi:hypothetical protein
MFFRRRAEQVLTVREQCSPAKSLEISHVTSYLVQNAHFYGVLRYYLARTTSAVRPGVTQKNVAGRTSVAIISNGEICLVSLRQDFRYWFCARLTRTIKIKIGDTFLHNVQCRTI